MRRANTIAVLVCCILCGGGIKATALKVCNDTYYSWRISVDGGEWQYFSSQGTCKCYQSRNCPLAPGEIANDGWGDIARKVKDRQYHIVFQYLADGRVWKHAFDIQMWGGYYTNVAQILDDGDGMQMLRMWWEPARQCRDCPTCRDKPPLDGCRNTSCLVPHSDDFEYRHEY